ncbi:MAG TPA: nucleotide exchange factor GrpE [Actinomycetota bacterium]|nr:nucleotide exchange factor GrpE [Actinomycetota bacterium]
MDEPRRIKVQVKDKRRVTPDEEVTKDAAEAAVQPDAVEPEVVEPEVVEPEVVEEPDYLGDLQRLQADFANYRKRMMRESAEAAGRGAERIVGQLLPVLDNFERAIAHGEGGEGVELVFKELKAVLESAGLEEVPGEGAPFDPQVHEAVESREDESVTEEVVRAVHRRGYSMNGKLLRAAMVGVARPAAPAEPEPDAAGETNEE